MRSITLYIFLLLVLIFFSCQKNKTKTLSATTRPAVLPKGAPKYSDVCFSSRWERPVNEQDTFDTFQAAAAFHVTYLNWVYTTSPSFIKRAKNEGYKVQIALTPTLEDLPFGSRKRERGRILDENGNPATAPWMKAWNAWWGCVNHPAFRNTYFAHIKMGLDAGATGFQVDDPGMTEVLVRNDWEDVCHCEYCTRKADSLGLTVGEIQNVSVVEFHRDMKKMAEDHIGYDVPFSCNNFRGEWALFPYDHFDFGIAEVPERRANPEYIYASIRETRRREKAQVFSFVSEKTWLIQKMIATTYAAGGNFLVPWDVWQGGGKDRYFGKPEDFSSYYGFVRANSQWLDGYEDAFYTNTQIDPRYQDVLNQPLHFDEYRLNTHAFIRVKPGDENAPVVVHLIDWEVLMNAFNVILKEDYFFEKGIGRIELLQPNGFDIKENKNRSGLNNGGFDQYSKISEIAYKKENGYCFIEIPQLENHWGILVVHKEKK